jgi:hypothetical protein
MYTYLKTASTYIFLCVHGCVMGVCACGTNNTASYISEISRTLYTYAFPCVCVIHTHINYIYNTYISVCVCVANNTVSYTFQICSTLYTYAFLCVCVCVYTHTHIYIDSYTLTIGIYVHTTNTHTYIFIRKIFICFLLKHILNIHVYKKCLISFDSLQNASIKNSC